MEDTAARSGPGLHAADFFAWTQRQAELMKAGRLAEVDLPNLIEEIETLGRAEYHSLRSSYRLVLMHLLKIDFQPSYRTDSWSATIVRERNVIEDILADNPALRARRSEAFAQAYAGARREAASETKLTLRTFPISCPYSLDEVEDHDWMPAA